MGVYIKVRNELIYFLKSLDNYNDKPFNKKIEDFDISVGFVYKELCEDFNIRLLDKIEACLAVTEPVLEKKTFVGWWNMMLGKGFRDDIRSFSEEFNPNAYYSIDMMKEEIFRIMKRMEKLGNEVDKLPKEKINQMKQQHSKYGHLNVQEWFDLCENNLILYKDLKEDLDGKLSRY